MQLLASSCPRSCFSLDTILPASTHRKPRVQTAACHSSCQQACRTPRTIPQQPAVIDPARHPSCKHVQNTDHHPSFFQVCNTPCTIPKACKRSKPHAPPILCCKRAKPHTPLPLHTQVQKPVHRSHLTHAYNPQYPISLCYKCAEPHTPSSPRAHVQNPTAAAPPAAPPARAIPASAAAARRARANFSPTPFSPLFKDPRRRDGQHHLPIIPPRPRRLAANEKRGGAEKPRPGAGAWRRRGRHAPCHGGAVCGRPLTAPELRAVRAGCPR